MKKGFFNKSAAPTASASKPATKASTTPQAGATAVLPSSIFPTSSSHNPATTLHWCFIPPSALTSDTAIARPICALLITQESKLELFSPHRSFPLPPVTSGTKWEIKEIPGKGKGIVAKEDIKKGETILEDRPILVWDEERGPSWSDRERVFQHALEYLQPDLQDSFSKLFNAFSTTSTSSIPSIGTTVGILQTNSFPIVQFSNITYSGIFPTYSRINHSCDNNSLPEWSMQDFKLIVRAKRDIKKGEEVTGCYILPFQKRQQRRDELEIKYKFECRCEWCSLSDEESAKKDLEREEMAKKFLAQWDQWTNR